MIEEPGRYAEDFKKAGADILSVHIEACPHLHRNIQQIKGTGYESRRGHQSAYSGRTTC